MQPTADPPEFSYSVNLSGVSPQELAVKFKDGRMSVYGEHVERYEDSRGAMNLSLRGFSNEVNLPSGVGTEALFFTVCGNQILKIQTKKPRPSSATACKRSDPDASTSAAGGTVNRGSANKPPPRGASPAPQKCIHKPLNDLPKIIRCHGPRCPYRTQNTGQTRDTNRAPEPECLFAKACGE